MGVSDVLYLKYQCEFYIIIFEIFKIVKQNKTSRYVKGILETCQGFYFEVDTRSVDSFPPRIMQ